MAGDRMTMNVRCQEDPRTSGAVLTSGRECEVQSVGLEGGGEVKAIASGNPLVIETAAVEK